MAETKPILVPLDGSKLAENAIVAAAWYSKAIGAPLQFIHVLDGDTDDRGAAAATFQQYADRLAAENGLGAVECQVLSGSPADQVLSASTTASAIVLATHGRGGFKAMIRGSVADKIVRGSAIPVLVEPGTDAAVVPGGSRPFVVGLDGSEEAERGLAAARQLAAGEKLRIILVRSVTMPPPVGVEFATYPADLMTSLEQAATDYLKSVATQGEEVLLMQGESASAIIEAAEQNNAGLIVLTSAGKGLTKRIALGSTTDRVIHSTERPVLVIPRTE